MLQMTMICEDLAPEIFHDAKNWRLEADFDPTEMLAIPPVFWKLFLELEDLANED